MFCIHSIHCLVESSLATTCIQQYVHAVLLKFVACAKGLRVYARTLWDQTDYQSVPNIPKSRTRQRRCDCAHQAVVWVNTTSWPAPPQKINLLSSCSYDPQLWVKSRPRPVFFPPSGSGVAFDYCSDAAPCIWSPAQPPVEWGGGGTSCQPAIQSYYYSRLNRTLLFSASPHGVTPNYLLLCRCVVKINSFQNFWFFSKILIQFLIYLNENYHVSLQIQFRFQTYLVQQSFVFVNCNIILFVHWQTSH